MAMGDPYPQQGLAPTVVSPGTLLKGGSKGTVNAGTELHGFGGLHGGLLLAMMASAMEDKVQDAPLRSITGRFHRPVKDRFAVQADVVRTGRAVSVLRATATVAGETRAEATATYGKSTSGNWPEFAPVFPGAPRPQDCEIFAIPPDFVPISQFMEIRPVGPNRPYAGGREPELTAWVRLTEDDRPPELLRFILLMDALAPSYAAVLSDLVLVPTVEITVKPSAEVSRTESPWVLLRARTVTADRGGWSEETIDAWGTNGACLGTATQFRMVRAE